MVEFWDGAPLLSDFAFISRQDAKAPSSGSATVLFFAALRLGAIHSALTCFFLGF